MNYPIYELKISESLNDESEVSYVALVDAPAIQKDFLAFNEQFIEPSKGEHETEFMPRCVKYMVDEGKETEQAIAICYSIWEEHFKQDFEETYNDYPKAASENAKIALRWAEENGWGSCGTPVGKKRASMLANGENLSRETIARMASFERHRQNSQKELGDGCGRLMWLAWGGDEGIEWAKRKLEQIDKTELKKDRLSFQVVSEDEHIISGPLMIADELIYRNNDKFGEHYVKFSADTIQKIAIKFSKKKYQSNVNLMHDPNQKVEGVTMFESFIVDKKRGILPMKGFEDVADGSWFGSFYVENDEVWNKVKAGEFKGFSVEGLFDYEEPKKTLTQEEQTLNKIWELLNSITEENFGGPGSGRRPEGGNNDNKTGSSTSNYSNPETLKSNTDKLINENIDTQKLYTDKNGKYNNERKEFHKELISNYMKDGSTNTGTSYFMGGAPATGKSSILDNENLVLPKGILIIDSDKIKGQIPEYNNMVKNRYSESASKVHEESSTLSKQISKNAANKKLDIVNDGVGDGTYESVAKKVEEQRKAGKKVEAHYVTTDTKISLDRAKKRGERTGRIVPETYIKNMHREISTLFPKFEKNKLFDTLKLYDNNGAKPRLIYEQKNGITTIYDKVAYSKFLKKSKEK